MDRTVTILHEGALAYYTVSPQFDGNYSAHLLRYSGSISHQPPSDLFIHKEGRHWRGEQQDTDLQDDIGYAIELIQLNNDLLFSPRKKDYE